MADMTDDDRWAKLASELGLDEKPKKPAASDAQVDDAAPKRRRRRSRKPGSEDPNSPEPTEDGADIIDPGETLEAGDETSSDKPKKRRRRRGRKKSDLAEKASAEETVGTETIEDDELAEPVSVANLPSWQELIDGLYRP